MFFTIYQRGNLCMKKVLSIWLAVILIAVNILPITSFADVAAEYVIDVSTSNEFSIPVGTDNKTYVLTGTNKDAEVYISRDCNIILRNATLRRIHINYADFYTVNITLEGENTIEQYNWASQGALEIYSSHVTINGGENDSLYAKSLTFSAYGPSWNGGSLTVNGGIRPIGQNYLIFIFIVLKPDIISCTNRDLMIFSIKTIISGRTIRSFNEIAFIAEDFTDTVIVI